jgi:hypothetical protein
MLDLPSGAAGMMGSSFTTTTVDSSALLLSSVPVAVPEVTTLIRGSIVESLICTGLELETDGPSQLLTAITGEAGNSVKPLDFEALFADFVVAVLFALPIDGNFSTLDALTLLLDESGPTNKISEEAISSGDNKIYKIILLITGAADKLLLLEFELDAVEVLDFSSFALLSFLVAFGAVV